MPSMIPAIMCRARNVPRIERRYNDAIKPPPPPPPRPIRSFPHFYVVQGILELSRSLLLRSELLRVRDFLGELVTFCSIQFLMEKGLEFPWMAHARLISTLNVVAAGLNCWCWEFCTGSHCIPNPIPTLWHTFCVLATGLCNRTCYVQGYAFGVIFSPQNSFIKIANGCVMWSQDYAYWRVPAL